LLHSGDAAVVALEHQLIHPTASSSVRATFVLSNDSGFLLNALLDEILALIFGYPPVQVLRRVAAMSVPHRSPLWG
jgi:hypothetical protein